MIKNSLYTLLLLSINQIVLADNISDAQTAVSNPSSTTTTTSTTTFKNTSNHKDSASSNVDNSDDNFYQFYVNGAVGVGVANSSDGYSYDGGFAGMVNVGLNFNKIFAIEGGYIGTSSSPTGDVLNAAFGVPTLNYSLYDIAMRSNLHLSQYFSFYGKVGGAIEQATWTQGNAFGQPYQPGPNTTSFGALLGAGASVDLGPIGIFLEFDQYLAITGQNAATPANLSLVNLGLQYNF